MIRSFQYTVQSARERAADALPPAVEASTLRAAFLEGYLSRATAGAAFLPGDLGATQAWIRFFELEKALYEIEYEINNRPTWVHIPLGGLVEILRGATL